MVEEAKNWLRTNSTLVYFLIAQFIGAGALIVSLISYMVNLEARVQILETRGSSHLAEINNRLTVTEKETEGNKQRLDKVVDIMTRRLGADIK
jgi:uncharacterized coiled-coil protein SlyX